MLAPPRNDDQRHHVGCPLDGLGLSRYRAHLLFCPALHEPPHTPPAEERHAKQLVLFQCFCELPRGPGEREPKFYVLGARVSAPGDRRPIMDRKGVYREIEEVLGVVQEFIKALPDSTLEMERRLFKRGQIEEGPIPNKYCELIGLAIASVTKCRYCTYFHTEFAKLNGASQAEIEDAVSSYFRSWAIGVYHLRPPWIAADRTIAERGSPDAYPRSRRNRHDEPQQAKQRLALVALPAHRLEPPPGLRSSSVRGCFCLPSTSVIRKAEPPLGYVDRAERTPARNGNRRARRRRRSSTISRMTPSARRFVSKPSWTSEPTRPASKSRRRTRTSWISIDMSSTVNGTINFGHAQVDHVIAIGRLTSLSRRAVCGRGVRLDDLEMKKL